MRTAENKNYVARKLKVCPILCILYAFTKGLSRITFVYRQSKETIHMIIKNVNLGLIILGVIIPEYIVPKNVHGFSRNNNFRNNNPLFN